MIGFGLWKVATRAGFWDAKTQGEIVDFTQAFALDRGLLSPYANRRRWRVGHLWRLYTKRLNQPSKSTNYVFTSRHVFSS